MLGFVAVLSGGGSVFPILEEGFFFSEPLKVIISSKTRAVRLIVLLHKEVRRLIALPVFSLFFFFFWKSERLWNRRRSFLPSFLYLGIKGERRF